MNLSNDTDALRSALLDSLLCLAIEEELREQTQDAENDADSALSPEEEARIRRAYDRALAEAAQEEKQQKKADRAAGFKRILPRVLEAAACLVLILGIATPIALATSRTFRSKVMQLLVEIDREKEEAHFSFQENESEAFFVPKYWGGDYFPSYLPDGFELTEYDDFLEYYITLDASNERRIIFSEMDEYSASVHGIENATVSQIDINGNIGTLIEGYALYSSDINFVDITWAEQDKWFTLITYNIESEEAYKIARSVRRIQQ